MSGPDYHGWTHRPKDQGGTDPIPGQGAIQWARKSKVSTTNQTINNAANTQITFNTSENTDTTIFDLSSTNQIQVLVDGLYSIGAQTEWDTYDNTTQREVMIYVVRLDMFIIVAEQTDEDIDFAQAFGDFVLLAHDVLRLVVHQDSGGNFTIGGTNDGSFAGATGEGNWLEARYLGQVGTL